MSLFFRITANVAVAAKIARITMKRYSGTAGDALGRAVTVSIGVVGEDVVGGVDAGDVAVAVGDAVGCTEIRFPVIWIGIELRAVVK